MLKEQCILSTGCFQVLPSFLHLLLIYLSFLSDLCLCSSLFSLALLLVLPFPLYLLHRNMSVCPSIGSSLLNGVAKRYIFPLKWHLTWRGNLSYVPKAVEWKILLFPSRPSSLVIYSHYFRLAETLRSIHAQWFKYLIGNVVNNKDCECKGWSDRGLANQSDVVWRKDSILAFIFGSY